MRVASWMVGSAAMVIGCSSVSVYQTPNSVQYPLPPAEDSLPPLLRAPASFENSVKQKWTNPTPQQRFWGDYIIGMTWSDAAQKTNIDLTTNVPTLKEKACNSFLAAFSILPPFADPAVTQLAGLRAVENCSLKNLNEAAKLYPAENKPLLFSNPIAWAKAISVQVAWLKDVALKAALTQAQAVGDTPWQVELLFDVAAGEHSIKTKVAFLQQALALRSNIQTYNTLQHPSLPNMALLQNEIYQWAPRLQIATNPSSKKWLAIAKDFKRDRQFAVARNWFNKIISFDKNPSDVFKAYSEIGSCYKLEENYQAWISYTGKAALYARKLIKTSPYWAEQYYTSQIAYARALWTHNGRDSAWNELESLIQIAKPFHALPQAYWVEARIKEEAKDLPAALVLLQKAQDEFKRSVFSAADSNLIPKIKWYQAWDLAKTEKYNEAILVLQNLLDSKLDEENSVSSYRDRFWIAKWNEKLNPNLSADQFDKLIHDDIFGFYGFLASRESKKTLFVPARMPLVHESDHCGFLSDLRDNTFRWLLSLKEPLLARAFLEAFWQGGAEISPRDFGTFVPALRCFQKAGAYDSVFAKVSSLPNETRQALIAVDPSLQFPMPFFDTVQKWSDKTQTPSSLLYAIMRQESSFYPMARSPAEAFGLLQVLPSLAKQSEFAEEVGYQSADDLFLPQINIPIGSGIIKNLMQRWKGQWIPAVASYNSSERVVKDWLQSRFQKDTLQFIEDVPYDETRGYIKLVMRNYLVYTLLQSNKTNLVFPDELLQISL